MDVIKFAFKCDICFKEFSQRSSRNRHVKEQHLQPGAFQCSQCGLRFSKKFNLQAHENCIHSKNAKKYIKCTYCCCTFTKLSGLKKHAKIMHKKAGDQETSSILLGNCNDTDPKTIAESVLEILKDLQKDINIKRSAVTTQQEKANEMANPKEITVKDKLYPLGHFKYIKTQTIERIDGYTYLICEFCAKEFRKVFNYLRHRRIHTGERPFICVLCKKPFATVTQLKSHCTIHKLHEKFGIFKHVYKCPKCEARFSSIIKLDKHLSFETSCNVTFKCGECLKPFKTLKYLLRHKHNNKDNELEFLDGILPAPLTVAKENKFENTFLNEKPSAYICNLCGLYLNSELYFKHHENRHRNLFINQCIVCGQSYNTKSSLKMHNKHHLNRKDESRDCQKPLSNESQDQLLTHGEKKFKCHYCNEIFRTAQNCRSHTMTHLKQLLKTHENVQEQIVTVTTVAIEDKKEVFTTEMHFIKTNKLKTKQDAKSLNKHMIYKCLKCDKSFRYAAWLKGHFKYKHTTERLYECLNCLKKFRTKQSLQSHFLVHFEKRQKLTCQVCGRLYASSKSLKLHLRIHTDEKPFKCDKCLKQFRTSGHYIQHRKSNHKE